MSKSRDLPLEVSSKNKIKSSVKCSAIGIYFFQLKHRNKISYRIISIAVLKANVRGWQRTAGQFSQTVLAVNETEERLP